jgi:putative transposase
MQHESTRKLLEQRGRGNFFGTFKNELIYRKPWLDRESVRKATSEYIEVFYNRIRRHSTIGNISPAKFEEMNQAEAA